MATKKQQKHTVDLQTGIGIMSFPRVFKDTAGLKDDGVTKTYDTQLLIPKGDKKTVKALLAAIKEVGEAAYGDNWKSVRTPLRDADKEWNDVTDDGSTKGDKYPERKGHYFINARSTKPVGVVDRDLVPIVDEDEIYGGVKAKLHITLYPYANNGNVGIGVGLNGVQKIGDGDPLGGGGKPAVESMFTVLDEDEDTDLVDEHEEPEEDAKPKAKKAKGKKSKKG